MGPMVAVEKIDVFSYVLFLEAENGDIYLVRLSQRGRNLYLDTSDEGGVALVLSGRRSLLRDPEKRVSVRRHIPSVAG